MVVNLNKYLPKNPPSGAVGKTKLIESRRTFFQYLLVVKILKKVRMKALESYLGVNTNIQLLKQALLRKQEKVDSYRLMKIFKKLFH